MISAFGSTNIGGANNKENQDTYFVKDHMFGVLDGHGHGGHHAAITACTVFSEACMDASFPKIFADAEEALSLIGLRTGPTGGGTTASVLYIDPIEGFCQVAHVGDSEVRYFDEDEGAGVSLTTDHSACSLEEFKRISALPGRNVTFEFAGRPPHKEGRPVFVKEGDDWVMNPTGGGYYCTVRGDWASYVICPYDTERLAITRALGDFNLKPHGLSAEPSVTTVPAPAVGVTRAIVLASDGLWDAMKYDEVRAIVRQPELLGNAEAATKALMEAALAANARLFGASADNVTAVVVYMTAPPQYDEDDNCKQGRREGICK